jgi:5-methylcytosine-specific restriction endonuclease McrA
MSRLNPPGLGGPARRRAAIGTPCPDCNRIMTRGGETRPSCDHIVPKSDGGTRHHTNIRIVCAECNVRRGNGPIPSWTNEQSKDPISV